jgi:hypothetical protein
MAWARTSLKALSNTAFERADPFVQLVQPPDLVLKRLQMVLKLRLHVAQGCAELRLEI